MEFKVLNNSNIKKPDNTWITVKLGDIVDLPDAYLIHPCLEENTVIPATKSVRKKKQDLNLDLNLDGKVDSEDGKIASKVLNEVKKNKRKANKK